MRVLTPILRNLLLHPARTFVHDDQRAWSGAAMLVASLRLASLIDRETEDGPIGLLLPTSGLFPIGIIAGWMLGRPLVPINYLLKPEHLQHVVRDSGMTAIVGVDPMRSFAEPIADLVPMLRLERIREMRGVPLRRPVRRDDDWVSALLYTSGTSGLPKGVMLTAGNLASNVRQCIEWAGFTRNDVVFGVLPQFHSFGFTVLTLLPLSVGARSVYTARFSPPKILDLLERHRPTAIIAIPSMYNALLAARSATPDHFRSLRFVVSGGEPLPAVVYEGFREKLSTTICEGYGLTETAPVTNWCRPHEHRRGSVGPALPQVEIKIASPTGEPLPPDTDGEVCLRGPNVMKGYHELPEETARVFDDEGFFRTGDMGRLAADGHLSITGRIKEMLIIGGENVFPREIEEVLNEHPDVHDSAVIGLPDPSRGEVPLAFVELAEDASLDPAAIRAFCRGRLPQYKVPREVRRLEALPRNPTGKILRRELTADTPSVDDGNATG